MALLIRHAERPPLDPGDAGCGLALTPDGERQAQELGALLSGRLRSISTSPLLRCEQTARFAAGAAGVSLPIRSDRLLGDPGAFVIDDVEAGKVWRERGHEWVMSRLVSQREPLPGMAPPDEASRRLALHIVSLSAAPGVHLFVTHDAVVAPTAAWSLGSPLPPAAWPSYLEGAFFWASGDDILMVYRDARITLPRAPT